MNVDFGVSRNGYCSDLQRTWYFLRASESVAPAPVRRGFETIVEAIQEAARAVRPGRTGAEIDGVARSYITARGFPEYPHGLGHQIGRTAHDGGAGLFPRWERYGNLPDVPIEAGQCFTIEPRLPIEGHGIATCEEIVVVTEDGHEFLSEPQRELYLIPAR
jgi:Xaa-Pro aminopeptidase